ncbi:ABC transporter [Grimontia sp. AD028]|uniref:ABC transporter ATP-binding protein n=1 Tax=Grimontia sp. AD028 TaxID=1581149 RepID=UPI00061B4941|nr:ABC transporter ATP-binding protein [Grimontia sp. AD028]KKD61187.1 ABC transporter [Grimontia sp. AD028]
MTANSLMLSALRSGFESRSVSPLDISLSHGQHLVIHGPSGCGKSSLLKVICGLLPASEGSIQWDSKSVTLESLSWWRTQVNYLPQDPVMGGDTIEAVLMLPWSMQATTLSKPDPAKCQEVLRSLSLQHALSAETSSLSGGEKQRLAIARALLLERPIWLMDEPTSALDGNSRDIVMSLLKAKDIIAVSVSHDPVWIAAADVEFNMGVAS